MGKKVEIQKTVFNRKSFQEVIDRDFKFFKELEPVVDPDTIEELFRLYDRLYITIPIEGQGNTHQYLVERSSELYKIDAQLDNIQPLLDEIASLRVQLLDDKRRILELETSLAGGGQLDFDSAEQMELLKSQLGVANSTIATLEQANALSNQATEQATAAANAAAEAAAAAAQTASESAQSTQATTQAVAEIKEMLNKKGSALRSARKALEKPQNAWNAVRGFQMYGRRVVRNLWWLYSDTKEDSRRYSERFNRRQPTKYNYLIPKTKDHLGDLTLDFLVSELKQAGFKAQEIVDGCQAFNNFKNNARFRLITYKDKDREDEVGYVWID